MLHFVLLLLILQDPSIREKGGERERKRKREKARERERKFHRGSLFFTEILSTYKNSVHVGDQRAGINLIRLVEDL
jgi:hypothetical protein